MTHSLSSSRATTGGQAKIMFTGSEWRYMLGVGIKRQGARNYTELGKGMRLDEI